MDAIFLSLPSFPPVVRAGLLAIAVVTITYITNVVAGLYTSPLASVRRGPRLCAISRLPYLIATLSGQQLHWLHLLQWYYGDVVRVARHSHLHR
jgi:hypothetical protein